MEESEKKEVFERWMKNVQHLEPEFFVRSEYPHKNHNDFIEFETIAISKLDKWIRRASSSLCIRGRKTNKNDKFYDWVFFSYVYKDTDYTHTFRLSDIEELFEDEDISAFTIFLKILEHDVDIYCQRHDEHSVCSNLFISSSITFEQMQIEADLRDIG